MASARGQCPSCGAPIEFGLGSSIAKVCEYCQATVLRKDHGFENLGKVARIAETPSLVSVGDEGTLGGRPFKVFGRVQLDHGKGPWDEYYVAFDYGNTWGWLAYAEGNWYATELAVGIVPPPLNTLRLEADVALGNGEYRVIEIKQGTVISSEGELPEPIPSGRVRYYADLVGDGNGFATLDYGDHTGPAQVFWGYVFIEAQLQVTQLGPRSTNKVKTEALRCPNCGGEVPKLSGARAKRLGCPYCGAISDIAAQQVIAQQEAALKAPDIPIGYRGSLEGAEYMCIATLRRSTDFDGDPYEWDEYLLWAAGVGFRWLVKDPEAGWSWVTPVNAREIDRGELPRALRWGDRTFRFRSAADAKVSYVLGEVYWQCEVGETTRAEDFVSGKHVLSRERSQNEVRYSYSAPMKWPAIAQAFSLPEDGPGSKFKSFASASAGGGGGSSGLSTLFTLIVIVVVLFVCMSNGFGGVFIPGAVMRSGGVSFGGK